MILLTLSFGKILKYLKIDFLEKYFNVNIDSFLLREYLQFLGIVKII